MLRECERIVFSDKASARRFWELCMQEIIGYGRFRGKRENDERGENESIRPR